MLFSASMPPKLAKLIAYCQANGIKGSYRAWHDPPLWRARISVGGAIHSGAAETEDDALDRVAGVVLDGLLDPSPPPGSREFVEWQTRRRG